MQPATQSSLKNMAMKKNRNKIEWIQGKLNYIRIKHKMKLNEQIKPQLLFGEDPNK